MFFSQGFFSTQSAVFYCRVIYDPGRHSRHRSWHRALLVKTIAMLVDRSVDAILQNPITTPLPQEKQKRNHLNSRLFLVHVILTLINWERFPLLVWKETSSVQIEYSKLPLLALHWCRTGIKDKQCMSCVVTASSSQRKKSTRTHWQILRNHTLRRFLRKVGKNRAFYQNPASMNAMIHWYFLKLLMLDTLTEILEKLHHSESMCYASTCGLVGKSPILCDTIQYNKILNTIEVYSVIHLATRSHERQYDIQAN